jgi:SAM-dependent methyltransferase
MKQCLTCNELFLSSENTCQSCGSSSVMLGGFPAYAPALAEEGPGFKSSYFTELASIEEKNFWFRARNKLIIWALGQYCPLVQSFLEIGCGTGYVLSGIAKAYPNVRLQGSELFIKGLSFASTRLPSVNLMQMDAKNIPFIAEFDSIGAFDVLEHIEEDRQVLYQIHQALKPQGIVLITVPQHSWLWSAVDDQACHVRRYSAKELHVKLRESGFEILRSTSFVTSLLPAMFISRFIQKFKSPKSNSPIAELNISSWLNFIFEKILNTEINLIQWGINFPLGGSRLIVARKQMA